MSKARFHIPSLDGLRAVSFGIVFAAHAGLGFVVPGGFGVTVFFFLSGFLITTLLRMEAAASGGISLRNFYIRRALRILPPFYLVLAVATLLAVTGFSPAHLEWRAVLAQALHYANYWVIEHGSSGFAPGTGVYWSLAVEEHFYLLFPLFYLLMGRLRATPFQQATILLALCVVILAWRCVLMLVFHSREDRTIGSDARFDAILFGCVLAVYGNPILDVSKISDSTWKYLLFPLGLLGLVFSFAFRDPNFRETFRYSVQGIALMPVFVCAVRYPQWGVMNFLNYRPVAFVGVLSFALYLIHQVVLVPVTDRLHGSVSPLRTLLCAVVTLAISLVLARLVQLTIEKPCARLRRRFSA